MSRIILSGFTSNLKKNEVKACTSTRKSEKFIAKVPSASVNRRITISSNFSVAKVKK